MFLRLEPEKNSSVFPCVPSVWHIERKCPWARLKLEALTSSWITGTSKLTNVPLSLEWAFKKWFLGNCTDKGWRSEIQWLRTDPPTNVQSLLVMSSHLNVPKGRQEQTLSLFSTNIFKRLTKQSKWEASWLPRCAAVLFMNVSLWILARHVLFATTFYAQVFFPKSILVAVPCS